MPKEFLWLYTALDPAAADLRPTLAQRLNRPASRAVIEERREPELCQREGNLASGVIRLRKHGRIFVRGYAGLLGNRALFPISPVGPPEW